jgi:hypothetical protein
MLRFSLLSAEDSQEIHQNCRDLVDFTLILYRCEGILLIDTVCAVSMVFLPPSGVQFLLIQPQFYLSLFKTYVTHKRSLLFKTGCEDQFDKRSFSKPWEWTSGQNSTVYQEPQQIPSADCDTLAWRSLGRAKVLGSPLTSPVFLWVDHPGHLSLQPEWGKTQINMH